VCTLAFSLPPPKQQTCIMKYVVLVSRGVLLYRVLCALSLVQQRAVEVVELTGDDDQHTDIGKEEHYCGR